MSDVKSLVERLCRTHVADSDALEACHLIEQQAARIAELEARLTAPSIKQLYRAHCSEYEDDYGPALRFDLDGFARALSASEPKNTGN